MSYYNTVKNYARKETIIKKSRFIASVKPVEKEEEAREFINEIKKEFYDATHNVYAYKLMNKEEIEKQHDDGEPGGTAGKPVLETIKNENLNDIVIVVTRYFGGVYLGAGGLVRSYSHAALEGIKKAGKIKKTLYDKLSLTIDYSAWTKLQNELINISGVVLDTGYSDVVRVMVLIPPDKVDYFKDFTSDLTGGTATIKKVDKMYYAG